MIGVRFLWGLPLGIVSFVAALVAGLTAAQFDTAAAPQLPGWAVIVAVAAGLAGWVLGMRRDLHTLCR